MTDLTPETNGSSQGENGQMALVVYILYLVSLVTGFTAIVGVIMAYVYKDNAPEWLRSHYVNAIHVFWKGLLYTVISGLLCLVLIGFLLLFVVLIWFIVRCVKGIVGVNNRQPYPNPSSWAF